MFWAVGIACAKVQRLERSDCISGTEGAVRCWYGAPGECCGDTRELAWASVVLGFAGIWILHEEQVYFRHSEVLAVSSFYFSSLGGLKSSFKPLSKNPVWVGARLGSAAS